MPAGARPMVALEASLAAVKSDRSETKLARKVAPAEKDAAGRVRAP